MSSSSVNSREIILKIFSKKHSLSLTPQSLGFLQNLSESYSLNSTNLASIADSLALAYLKQDDCSSIVDADVLKKVYLNLQLNYAGGISTLDNEDYVNEDEIDPRNYLKIVDAFDIPRYSYAVDNKSFVKHNTHSIAAHPSSLSQLWLDRYNTIKQIILRNEFFSPPSTVAANNHDRDNYMKITSTKNLLGRHNHRFMLFGMLSQTTDGRHALQDPDGVVVLDLSDAVPGEGLFTEGSFVLVDGVYELLTDEPIFKTYGIGHPPSEKRSSSQDVHGHIDFLGLGGISLKDQPITSSRDIREYHDSFNKLADIICEYPLLAQHSTFVFVPGPNDPWSSGTTTTLPRKRIPTTFTRTFEAKVSRTYFTSNPTRIRYFSQEIVVCRDDAMSRILRNNVKVKEENGEDGEDMDVKLKKFLVQTVIDQAHLSPFTINTRPVLWEYDHTLRLYPIPTSLILADKYDRYELKYEGCRVFNPGSFSFEYSGALGLTCRHLNRLSKDLSIVHIAGPNPPNLAHFNMDGKGMYEIMDNEKFERDLAVISADSLQASSVRQIRYRDTDSVNERVLEHLKNLPNLTTVIIQCTSVLSMSVLRRMRRLHTLNVNSIVSAKDIPINDILNQCPALNTLTVDMMFYKHYSENNLNQLDGVMVGNHPVQTVVLRHKLCGKCYCAHNHNPFDLVAVYLPTCTTKSLSNKPLVSLVRVHSRSTLVDVLARAYGWEREECAVEEELAKAL
ncbi:hypothetical protein E3P77_01729 [Wallemia ichthyophaga]|nr:hypothetical protein E3P95_00431 [Wallemia ichthyophaga]TIB04943.1 hypothetical protein E3P94_00431 [Wallemia ichthyophaga]TIB37472.1 hypothetical protein E3P84_00245 [Wallemia ichthyophaga]TIB44296.1 hypothetical protein E3P83_00245 [Wallemia ichthyophaga]TIB67175.1 hypothetical protein E3P77_01729 [Wallemia ichthyophaga]